MRIQRVVSEHTRLVSTYAYLNTRATHFVLGISTVEFSTFRNMFHFFHHSNITKSSIQIRTLICKNIPRNIQHKSLSTASIRTPDESETHVKIRSSSIRKANQRSTLVSTSRQAFRFSAKKREKSREYVLCVQIQRQSTRKKTVPRPEKQEARAESKWESQFSQS